MHGFFVVVHADGGQCGVEVDFLVIRRGGNGFFKRGEGLLVLALRQQHVAQAEAGLGIGGIERKRLGEVLHGGVVAFFGNILLAQKGAVFTREP